MLVLVTQVVLDHRKFLLGDKLLQAPDNVRDTNATPVLRELGQFSVDRGDSIVPTDYKGSLVTNSGTYRVVGKKKTSVDPTQQRVMIVRLILDQKYRLKWSMHVRSLSFRFTS